MELGLDPPADLRGPHGDVGGNWDSSWGHRPGTAILGNSFYHKNTGAGSDI